MFLLKFKPGAWEHVQASGCHIAQAGKDPGTALAAARFATPENLCGDPDRPSFWARHQR